MRLLSKLINNNFIKGIASILNIYPASSEDDYTNITKERGFMIDAKNMSDDWKNIGKDMAKAINKYTNNYKC